METGARQNQSARGRKEPFAVPCEGELGNPSEWEIRYRRLAIQNFADLSEDCTYEDMLSTCIEASQQIGSEFEHCRLSKTVLNEARLERLTPDELQDAKELALRALNNTEPGTSKQRLQRIRDDALSDYYQIIEERELVETHHATCKKLIDTVYWELGHHASTTDKYRAQRELKEALGTLPVPAAESEIQRVRNSVVERIKSEIEAQVEAKEKTERARRDQGEKERREREQKPSAKKSGLPPGKATPT